MPLASTVRSQLANLRGEPARSEPRSSMLISECVLASFQRLATLVADASLKGRHVLYPCQAKRAKTPSKFVSRKPPTL